MSKRTTLASLDARVIRLEERMTAQDDKLDMLIAMGREHNALCRTRITARTKIVASVCGVLGAALGIVAALVAGGCA